jgi:biotin synthase-related radical SAM superfamily protein
MAKKYYTVSEAAKHLKIGRAGVHVAIRAGRLHAEWATVKQVIVKRAYVISAEELKRFKPEVNRDQQERGKKSPKPG